MTTKATRQTAAVTTIDQLKAAMEPELVELPGFAPDTTVTFRLRRANLRTMAQLGKIPNPLLAAAQKLYEGVVTTAKTNFQDTAKVMNIVVASAMVEPTMEQLTDAGIELTEQQFALIWNYSQMGAEALKAFRAKSRNFKHDQDGQGVEGTAQ